MMRVLFNIKFSLFISFTLISFSFTTTTNAQESNSARWNNELRNWELFYLEKTDSQKLTNRWNEIKESLKITSNPFADAYFDNNMSGFFLIWSPEKGFLYVPYFDDTIICDFSYGKVLVTDSEVVFLPEREITREFCGRTLKKTPRTWISALGGKLLIPEDKIKLFGDFYGGFGDFTDYPRSWDGEPFAERTNKFKEKSSKTTFIVPEKYLQFIKKPILAEIVKLGQKRLSKNKFLYITDEKVSVTNAVINVGRRDGVTKDLKFHFINKSGNDDQFLRIKKVGERTSQAVIVRRVNDKLIESYDEYNEEKREFIKKPFSKLLVGIKVTTSPVLAGY